MERLNRDFRSTAVLLESLTLVPTGGLCNRLRAIASARRLCERCQARLTVVWDWGKFADYFERIAGVQFLPSRPVTDAHLVRHYPTMIDPSPTRLVDVGQKTIELHSGYVFSGSDEKTIKTRALIPFTPRPNARLASIIHNFADEKLQSAVGFHIRRTDHLKSRRYSPDKLFIERARKIVSQGKSIFLATDNTATECRMRRLFGPAIIVFPKRQTLAQRWPRPFDSMATEDDIIDLFLLAETEYVLGSYNSTYSYTAMRLNGSPNCAIISSDWRVRAGRLFSSIRSAIVKRFPPLKRALQRRHDRWQRLA
jgi:hypothetical protein